MNTLTLITGGMLQVVSGVGGRVYIDGIEYLDTTELPNLHKVDEPDLEIVAVDETVTILFDPQGQTELQIKVTE